MIVIDYKDRRPIYEQVVERFQDLIVKGVIRAGEQMPSVRSLAMELAPSHIRVNCVAPGVIETDMVRTLGAETLAKLVEQTPAGRLGRPEDVAKAVAFLVREDADFITGQVLTVDGGFIL